jgi:hypothetical protein
MEASGESRRVCSGAGLQGNVRGKWNVNQLSNSLLESIARFAASARSLVSRTTFGASSPSSPST